MKPHTRERKKAGVKRGGGNVTNAWGGKISPNKIPSENNPTLVVPKEATQVMW